MIAQHVPPLAAEPHNCGYPHPIAFVFLQDAPFAVVNSLLLLRTVNDLKGTHDDATVTLLLLVLLSSVASLMYKVMKLRTFPEVWREYSRLLREKIRLTERAERLKTRMETQAPVVPHSEGSDVESVSSDIGSDCATTMLSHGRRINSAQLESAAMPVAVLLLSTSADGAGVHSSQASPSSLSQLPRIELTTFEICMLPECGR
jgi:hypothetical protein